MAKMNQYHDQYIRIRIRTTDVAVRGRRH